MLGRKLIWVLKMEDLSTSNHMKKLSLGLEKSNSKWKFLWKITIQLMTKSNFGELKTNILFTPMTAVFWHWSNNAGMKILICPLLLKFKLSTLNFNNGQFNMLIRIKIKKLSSSTLNLKLLKKSQRMHKFTKS